MEETNHLEDVQLRLLKRIALIALAALGCAGALSLLLPVERATLELDAARKYRFELAAGEGGDIPAGLASEISGDYAAGARIELSAHELPGYRFERWEAETGRFDDARKPGAVFTMPAGDVVVTAQFVEQ